MILMTLANATAAFDPEAATNAYLATLNGAARAKSDSYFEGGYWLPLWGTLLSICIDLFVLKGRIAARLRDWAERVTKWRGGQVALFIMPYILISTIISLPWTIYTGYFREKHYDLMSQTFGGWAGDQLTDVAINLVVAALIAMALFAVIRRSPKRWWLWGAGVMSLITAFGAMVAPVYIAPLFNTYTEMKAGPLRDRIVAMAAANQVPAKNIYVFDASKQSKRVSANVSGLGPTIRISLNDNLLNRTTPDEVVAVMGHELGHYVLGHVFTSVAAFTLIFLVVFWFVSWIVPWIIARYGEKWGVRGMSDPAVIPIMSVVMSVVFLLLTPVTNSIIRNQESQADAFGLDAAREPDAEAKIDIMLGEYRKLDPGRLEEIIFFDHPSGRARVRMAMDWKAAHLAEVQAKEAAKAK
jgi:STE24 endopeptidase